MDPYGDPAGDGWNNMQKYQNGMDPNVFYTPPAPQGLTVTLGSGGTSAILRWQAVPLAVNGYTIQRLFASDVITVSSGITQVPDNSPSLPTGLYFGVLEYCIQAHYANGDSAWSGWVSAPESLAPAAQVAIGNNEQMFVVIQSVPPTAATLRVERPDLGTNWDFAVGNIANGQLTLPDDVSAQLLGSEYYYVVLQWVSTNAALSAAEQQGWPWGGSPAYFLDGREQLKQNLTFLLRVANAQQPFNYLLLGSLGPGSYQFYSWPTNYAYAGFYSHDNNDGNPDVYVNEFQPFNDNYLYLNFVFDPTNLDDTGLLMTGVGLQDDYAVYPYY